MPRHILIKLKFFLNVYILRERETEREREGERERETERQRDRA